MSCAGVTLLIFLLGLSNAQIPLSYLPPQQQRLYAQGQLPQQQRIYAQGAVRPLQLQPGVVSFQQVQAHGQTVATAHSVAPSRVQFAPPATVQSAAPATVQSAAPATVKPAVSAVQKDYRPDPASYTYDYNYNAKNQPSFTYDPQNPKKNFNYQYNFEAPRYELEAADIPVNVPAEDIVDSVIYETQTQGEKIVRVLKKLTSSKLIARAIEATAKSGDPCSIIPNDLDITMEDLINAITDSRESLVNVIAAIQDMKRNEDDTVQVIKSASQAVLAMEPMLPLLKNVFLFRSNPACENSIQATINKVDGIGNVLDTLGQTNLVSSDPATKNRLIQGGAASRVISRTAGNLEQIKFTKLCSDSPTFTADVFAGVAELLVGLRDVSASFNANPDSLDISKLDQTVNLMKEGADLLADLNFTEDFDASYEPRADCVTSLPDVAKSLAEVADLVDVFDADSLKSIGRRR